MTDLWMPEARQSPQAGGVTLNTSLPPRAVWHITWDALRPGGGQPNPQAVSDYLKRVGYCPTLMWNPFTGDIEQFYPANEGGRALVAWNEDGAVNIQIEVFFSPGCVVDGVQYGTVADTPCVNLDKILAWIDSFGVPRVWPLGAPQWQGNSRDADTWNSQAGHYGHCNVPGNTHSDPGPMPDLNSVTAVPDSAPAAPTVDDGVLGDNQCRVVAGDTLSGIARQFGVSLDALIALNGITEPDKIFPDMILDLPQAPAAAPAPAGLPEYCTVDDGDTLSGIASQFGVSLDYLLSRNPGINPDLIVPDQRINL